MYAIATPTMGANSAVAASFASISGLLLASSSCFSALLLASRSACWALLKTFEPAGFWLRRRRRVQNTAKTAKRTPVKPPSTGPATHALEDPPPESFPPLSDPVVSGGLTPSDPVSDGSAFVTVSVDVRVIVTVAGSPSSSVVVAVITPVGSGNLSNPPVTVNPSHVRSVIVRAVVHV
ncbi:hypothetical protein ASPCAL07389 [Aspergillus calidoustus]|uniref:Uncharacterized protein n=1 Tax=Aspergillus calidoustus TaxID=454130 RepID=A0A0U5G3J7_ASPCI|nr:hypothetical protein ASPCAL07389 [Aspergillus calidoustus]